MRLARRSLLIAFLAACGSAARPATAPAPIAVEGTAPDLRRLAGRWYGEFQSEQGDRRGTILFRLAVDSGTAFGSVILQPPPVTSDCTDPARPVQAAGAGAPIVLRVGGAATSAGSVGGWMRPYVDPEYGCLVDTWFEGRLVRDTLRGTYFSRRTAATPIRTGSWWAARQRR